MFIHKRGKLHVKTPLCRSSNTESFAEFHGGGQRKSFLSLVPSSTSAKTQVVNLTVKSSPSPRSISSPCPQSPVPSSLTPSGASSQRLLSTVQAQLFWENWLQHEAYLYRCCLRWLKYNHSYCEELMHRGMLKAYDKFAEYSDRILFMRGWLRQLLFRLYLDQCRQQQHHWVSLETLETAFSTEESASPWAIATGWEMEGHLARLTKELPPPLYQAFCLRFYEEQSYEAISQTLNITPCNARKRVQLAKQHLKRLLTPYLSQMR